MSYALGTGFLIFCACHDLLKQTWSLSPPGASAVSGVLISREYCSAKGARCLDGEEPISFGV